MLDNTTNLIPKYFPVSAPTQPPMSPMREPWFRGWKKASPLLLLGRLAPGRRAHAARRVTGEDARGHRALVIALLNLGPAGDLTRLVELRGAHLTHAAFRLFCPVRFLLRE